MKSLFFLYALLCASHLHAQLQAWVSLGRAQSCEGAGICRIETKATPQAYIGCRISVLRNGKLQLSFSRKQLQDADYLRHFATGFFFVEQDVLLPGELSSALGSHAPVLRKGRYAVYDEGAWLSLIF